MGLLMMLLRSGVLSRTRFKIQDPLFVTYIVLSTVKCVLKKHYNNGSICLFYIRIKKPDNKSRESEDLFFFTRSTFKKQNKTNKNHVLIFLFNRFQCFHSFPLSKWYVRSVTNPAHTFM